MGCAAIPDSKQSALLLTGCQTTILVVEDDGVVGNATCELLCGSGYDVLQAEDAGCAKRLFAESEEEIDLLLCDAVLPDENGVDLAEWLCGISPGLRVVLVSGIRYQH
jgi:DNA-binding response OmpR family regulator